MPGGGSASGACWVADQADSRGCVLFTGPAAQTRNLRAGFQFRRGAELGQHTMGEEGEAPPAGYYEFGSDPPSGEGQRNDNKERHGQGQAWFANGDR